MTAWRRGLLGGLVVALIVGLAITAYFAWQRCRTPPEPLYLGKPMEHWLERLATEDPDAAARTAHGLAAQGEEGLAVLLEARQGSDLRAHRRAVRALIEVGGEAAAPLVEALPRGGSRVEVALVRIGSPAVPALEQALRDPGKASLAARVLGKMGARGLSAVPALVGLIQDRSASAEARIEAARALGQICPERDDGPLLAALRSTLADPQPALRREAALALGQIGRVARPAVPDLAALVRSSDHGVVTAACETLARLGAVDQTAGASVASLLAAKALAGDDSSPRAAAALGRLGRAALPAVPALVSALRSTKEDGRLARAVLERLGTLVVPDLEKALAEKDADTRRAAAEVLGLMGPRAMAAVESLGRLLEDSEPAVVLTAAQALVRIEPEKARPAAVVLVRFLKASDEKVSEAAAFVLRSLGPEAALVVPDLLTLLAGKDAARASRAANVLGYIRPAGAEVVAKLRAALKGPDETRQACIRALGLLGAEARSAIGELQLALDDAKVRPAAALALVRIDPSTAEKAARALADDLATAGASRLVALAPLHQMQPVPADFAVALRPLLADPQSARVALPVVAAMEARGKESLIGDLVSLLSSTEGPVREQASAVLRLIGPPALQSLKAALSAPGVRTRAAAAWALGSRRLARGKETEVVSWLARLMDDSDEVIRQAATASIGRLGARSKETRDAMLNLLVSPAADLRRSAVLGLGGVLPDDRPRVLAHLVECLFDPDELVRQLAAAALGEVGSTAEVVPALTGAVEDPSPGVRLAALEALQLRKWERTKELAAVLKTLAQQMPAEREGVLSLLHRVAPEAAQAFVPELEADLRGESIAERVSAGLMLVRLEPMRAPAMAAFLVGVLNGWDADARYRAAVALGEMRQAATGALPALRRKALDEDRDVRMAAGEAIEAIEKGIER